jgi:NitT/TauT family transport system substrate-binding protein
MHSSRRGARALSSRISILSAASLIILMATLLPAFGQDVPELKVGYVFTTHHTPLMVAATQGDKDYTKGVYLRPLIAKEKYELIADGKKMAILDLVVTKSGSETATLFAQKHMDVAMASVTAIMAGIDKGTPVKILGPLQTEGMALVMPKDSPINGWEELVSSIKKSKKPAKIGYHSPTSAPKIVLERALQEAGLKVTGDPNDLAANVVLADLKATSNMIPALNSKQVDGIVGPSPFPEVAVTKGVGKIVVDLRDLPPAGFWHDFPCCVTAAREDIIAKHPEVVQKLIELIARTGDWCNKNKAEAGILTAKWIGVPTEVGNASSLVFLSAFNDGWMRGAGIYMDILNKMGDFSGKLTNKKLEDVKPIMFDLRFINQVKL